MLAKSITTLFLFLSSSTALGADSSIRLFIVDSITRVPVDAAQIFSRDKDQLQKLGDTTGGRLDFEPPSNFESITLSIRAPGYENRGGTLKRCEVTRFKQIELDRTHAIEGVIIAPTGHPIGDTAVTLITRSSHTAVTVEGRLERLDHEPPFKSFPDGRFSLKPVAGAESILAVHDLGLAQIPVVVFTNGTRILLRPWRHLPGRMLVNNVPASEQKIAAIAFVSAPSLLHVYLRDFETRTDKQGRFTFEKMPPAEIRLAWQSAPGRLPGPSHPMTFPDHPFPGAEITYHIQGRNLTGQLKVPSKPDLDWRDKNIYANLVSTERAVRSDFSPHGSTLGKYYSIGFNETGALKAAAIPPGEYELTVNIFSAVPGTATTLRSRITVPPGEGAANIGEVTLNK